jgi:XamI restriction endonuclease
MSLMERTVWSGEELERDIILSKAEFRKERLEEPVEAYSDAFEQVRDAVENLIEATVDLSQLEEKAAELLQRPDMLDAMRYLAGPPISRDDLVTLLDTTSIAPATLQNDPGLVKLLVQTIRDALDRKRFPWVSDKREPSGSERYAAIIASSALMATQRAATSRRAKGKKRQEEKVRQLLLAFGMEEVLVPGKTRLTPTHARAPKAGQFCREHILGDDKADLIIRLWDGRTMPVECKVSNSSINSRKRLNMEAAAKAERWIRAFGDQLILPTSVISGVFKREYVENAQHRGLTIYWSHNLKALTDWLTRLRENAVTDN